MSLKNGCAQLPNWSQTKDFCSTLQKAARLPHFFELDNFKNEAILRDFLQKWLSAELTATYQCVLRFFRSICLKYRACNKKVRPHLSRKIILATPLKNSAPGPLNIYAKDVSCTAPATRNASLQIFFKHPTTAIAFETATKPSRFAHFWQHTDSLAPATKWHLNVQKWSEHLVLNIVTSKYQMCFAPHLRTLFQIRNFQKCSNAEVLLSFWPGNALRATAVRNTFSATQFPKVLRRWGAFVILTWKCASCHSCAQHFFSNAISKSAPTLRCWLLSFWLGNVLRATTTCNFWSFIPPDVSGRSGEPTFRPSRATKHLATHWKKHTVLRLFFFFAHLALLSTDSFSSLTAFTTVAPWLLSQLLLHLSIFGSLTSKLPRAMWFI